MSLLTLILWQHQNNDEKHWNKITLQNAATLLRYLSPLPKESSTDFRYIYTGCPKKNDPTLQYHIFKNIKFDVFKFSTVI